MVPLTKGLELAVLLEKGGRHLAEVQLGIEFEHRAAVLAREGALHHVIEGCAEGVDVRLLDGKTRCHRVAAAFQQQRPAFVQRIDE